MEFLKDEKKLFLFTFAAFFLFQFFSFLGYLNPFLSGLFFLLIIIGTFYLTLKNTNFGLLVLFFEFLAGHEGHLFSFKGISLRLSLFLVVMIVWFLKRDFRRLWKKKLKFSSFFLLFIFFLVFGLIKGFLNNSLFAIKDFINYAYLFLAFPLAGFFKERQNRRNIYVIFKALIPAIFLLTVFVLILFSTGLAEVHDQFYWWWRGTVIGKATYAGFYFYRIVTPAHLLVLPLLLLALSLWFASGKDEDWEKKALSLALIFGTAALLINFSRAYFLGLLVGLLFLAIGLPKKTWLLGVSVFLLILISELVILFAVTSGGQTLGFDFFGQRMKTLVAPEEELSSATRLMILPVLVEKIKEKPLLGSGLGMEVSYPDPQTREIKKTRHLDWGYLEILAELGIFGFLSFFGLIASLFVKIKEQLKTASSFAEKRIVVGLGAGLLSLLLASITGPFLFHALGIFYLSLVIAFLN